MTHENSHFDILAALGNVQAPASSTQAVMKALAPDSPPPTLEQIAAEEKALEQQQQQKIEITIQLDELPKPCVAAFWNGTEWEVTVREGQDVELLDPRKRNLLQRAMTIALRRHERRRQYNFRLANRKSEAEKRQEVEVALEQSRANGTLSEHPGQRLSV